MAKSERIQIRVEEKEKEELTKKASKNGFSNLSEYMLFLARHAEIKVTVKK